LQKKLWPIDTFVDFEQGLNNAMKRLRTALDDNAESPRFIETVLCLTKMPFNLRRLLFATQTDGLERFPRMCRSSDRMIELNRTCAHLSPVGETDFKGWRGPCAVIGSGLSGAASLVAMVKTADLRQRYDSSHFPRLNQARFGRVVSQREMGSAR